MDARRPPVAAPAAVLIGEPTREVLRALLQVDAEDARRVRERTPARRQPRPQVGPTADYGADNPGGADRGSPDTDGAEPSDGAAPD